jgi:hypothetical protein
VWPTSVNFSMALNIHFHLDESGRSNARNRRSEHIQQSTKNAPFSADLSTSSGGHLRTTQGRFRRKRARSAEVSPKKSESNRARSVTSVQSRSKSRCLQSAPHPIQWLRTRSNELLPEVLCSHKPHLSRHLSFEPRPRPGSDRQLLPIYPGTCISLQSHHHNVRSRQDSGRGQVKPASHVS